MLMIGRRAGERVRITVGDVTVWVTFTESRSRNNVRLGFEAPPGVEILREEVVAAQAALAAEDQR